MTEVRHTVRAASLALSVLVVAAGLGVLSQLRAPLPTLPHSWFSSWPESEFDEFVLFVVWVLLVLALAILLALLLRELRRTLAELRAARTWARYAHVIPRPLPPPERKPHTYRPKVEPFWATLAPRVEPQEADGHVTDGDDGSQAGKNAEAAARSSRSRTASGSMPSISLLGPLRIEEAVVRERRLRSASKQLVAYLALHPEGANRDVLIEAIWPGQDPQRYKRRLYQCAADVRAALVEGFVAEGEHYRLERSRVRIDLAELEALLAAVREADGAGERRELLEQALSLFRGAPLQGLDYPWADAHARRLRVVHAELLERTGQARLLAGDANGALDAAQCGLDMDSLNEGLWRLAMLAESRLGLRESLATRYQQLSELLGDQLGLEPEETTRALYYDLLGQR